MSKVSAAREREVGTLYLPEVRRFAQTVTRAFQGILSVEARRHAGLVDDDGRMGRTLVDSLVVLEANLPTDDDAAVLELRLLPGEARSLAALLTRAADEVELNLGPEVADRNAFGFGRQVERAGL